MLFIFFCFQSCKNLVKHFISFLVVISPERVPFLSLLPEDLIHVCVQGHWGGEGGSLVGVRVDGVGVRI